MPNQDNQNQSSPTNVPPVISPKADIPPLPPDFQNVKTDNLANPPVGPAGSAAPPNLPPVVSQTPKKKFGGGRIIATILGILLLIGGVGAGIYLTQQRQVFQQKAAGCTCPDGTGASCTGCTTGDIVGDQIYCSNCSSSGGPTICAPGYEPQAGGGANGCVSTGTTSGGGGGSVCIGCTSNVGAAQGMYSVTSLNVSKTSPTTALLSWTYGDGRACPKRGGTFIFVGTDKAALDNNCGLPGAGSWDVSVSLPAGCKSVSRVDGTTTSFTATNLSPDVAYYFRVVSRWYYTQTFPNHPGESEDQGDWCPGITYIPPTSTPTPTPTPPGPTAQCLNVKAYTGANWLLLDAEGYSHIIPGDIVNFCVAGSASSGVFDKAQFKVNATLEPETTTKRPGSNDYCQSYKILPTDTTINVKAKIHHQTLGWEGESI